MRRLPGPAVCRLGEGAQAPEAHYELFRDWQRTPTQSSVGTLQSLRQQMDVRFCECRNHQPRGTCCAAVDPDQSSARSPERAIRPRVFS
jgi:hypothetical protein